MRFNIVVFSLLGGMAIAPAAVAQFQRYPTAQEVRSLTQALQRKIPQLQQSGTYRDRRTPAQRQARDNQVRIWSKIDPAVAPFLGEWTALEESQQIYPTRIPGQVCVIDSFIPERDESGYEFSLGKVTEGKIRTADRTILVREGNFLGSIYVYKGKARLYEYAFPRPLKPITEVDFAKRDRQVMEQFQKHGCLTDPLQ